MAALTRQILRTVTLAALALALQIALAPVKPVRVIGSWKIEDKRDPTSGKPWMLVQAGGPGSWIQIRCESVSDPGKGLSLLGPAPAKGLRGWAGPDHASAGTFS
jgi:hypothetical protein